ncbi:6-hydroxymethylpterin diphosphokinase MptE-like protein [Halalkalicoccus subterraneus]|uniref:6-hydroxymethylpterin diphosphokinase MptE-like protein n=1 Tax=Halalkalicoccus subterraneus TaxID=2675002 RepID=UPI000EFC64D2|nr:6-hydroxymethylpterin diphosphokinase MptE-like protein [Halalkalicoccus subterraneus]
MNFPTWNPVYETILADFGFGRREDERARDVLADLTESFDEGRLARIEGAAVAVAGAGPSLPDDLELAAEADYVIAASTAADTLLAAGIEPDLFVTDIDKNPETLRELTRQGTPAAVHAHGDNIELVERWVPRLAAENVLPTTQAAPKGPVENFGGFTDGDRGAFLADHFGASELRFPGWTFDDPSVGSMKARKLRWAERLLYWLETRRGERFAVLDGRRDGIEPVK